jgi:hypothetical protein
MAKNNVELSKIAHFVMAGVIPFFTVGFEYCLISHYCLCGYNLAHFWNQQPNFLKNLPQ